MGIKYAQEFSIHIHSDPPFIQKDKPISLKGLLTIGYILVLRVFPPFFLPSWFQELPTQNPAKVTNSLSSLKSSKSCSGFPEI